MLKGSLDSGFEVVTVLNIVVNDGGFNCAGPPQQVRRGPPTAFGTATAF